LPQLLEFTRERYPAFYCNRSLFYEGTGREWLLQLWANYLKSAEQK
jgi:hypothetical protein